MTARSIYILMVDDGRLKIGASADPAKRLVVFKATMPSIRLMFQSVHRNDGARIEKAVHRRLAKWCVGGEWFAIDIAAARAAIESEIAERDEPEPIIPNDALQRWITAERASGRHWTQAKVAERLGVHASTLNHALKGKVDPRASLVRGVEHLTKGAVRLADWPTSTKDRA